MLSFRFAVAIVCALAASVGAQAAAITHSDPSWTNLPYENRSGRSSFITVKAKATNVPEPASLILLGVGLVGVGVVRRMRSAKEHRSS